MRPPPPFFRTTSSALRLGAPSTRIEVCPPSLRQVPDSGWRRLWFWLAAPAPLDAAPPLNRLPQVRQDFVRCLADLRSDPAAELHRRVGHAHTLRELWHLRAEVYRVVAVERSQQEAEQRVAALNRHFAVRAPRAAPAPLSS